MLRHKMMSLMGLFGLALLCSAAYAGGWEFNDNGNFERWSGEQAYIDMNDGRLVVDMRSVNNAPKIVAQRVIDANSITGVYAKMALSVDHEAIKNGGRTALKFWGSGGNATVKFTPPEIPHQDEVVFIDLFGEANWSGEVNSFFIELPSAGPNDIQASFDWIRFENILIENESFEYWDIENDKVVGWTASAAYDFPDPMDPNFVNTRDYAAVVTGTGQSETIAQDIKGGLDLPKGQTMLVEAAVLVPSDAAGTEVVVHVAEQSKDGQWTAGSAVAVDTLDAYTVIASEVVLTLEPADRTELRVEVSITSPAGKVVYLDDVFVNTLPAVREPAVDAKQGWPVNCVKLSEGQEIVVDGVVTAEEYAGAQAIVINQDTAYGIDPYDPNYTHAMQIRPNQRKAEWINTPLEDYNGTYYVMWDDDNFYIACSVEDDFYTPIPEGKYGNSADGLQFTLTERILDTVKPYIYIPTLGLDASGTAIAKNNFNAANYIDYDLFQHPEVTYDGAMDPDTQDWTMELKIPWIFMIGDFQGDLVNGDLDGDGKNVFPPAVGDTVGFAIMAIDYDEAGSEQLSGTHIGSWPWQHFGRQTPDGVQTQEPLIFVDENGQIPQ